MVAQPVHGLRPPLHVLLRPRVRAPAPTGRRTRATARRSGSRRTSSRSCGASSRGRCGHASRSWWAPPRTLPARRGPLPADPRRVEALAEARTPFGLITRGPLIVRDVDVLARRVVEQAEVAITFSIPTLDREIWRRTEPGTAPPAERLRALRTLVDAGIDASVGMAPILPGLSDDPAEDAPTSSVPPATPAPRRSGRTCSTCDPGRASTSSTTSPATGRSCSPMYERLYAGPRLRRQGRRSSP